MSYPVKNKKKNKMLNQESNEVPTKKKKKSKLPMEEENIDDLLENDEVVHESDGVETIPVECSSPSKKDRDGVEADNWTKEDYKELIRRMEEQIPKNDKKSYSNRVEKLDWSLIQFGSHSVEECYEKWKVLKTKVRGFRILEEVLHDAKAWAESPWDTSINNRKTKNRHPDQPTRPLTSFMLFYLDKKEKIMKKHPNLKLPDISRMIGDKYKALSESKKAHYIQRAAVLQEEYKQQLKEFYEKHPDLVPVSKRKTKPDEKPLAPFKLFLKEKLRKHENDEGFNKHEYTDKCKLTWKNLSLKKKVSWIRLAKEEEDKYWKQREDLCGERKPEPHKSVLSKDDIIMLERIAGKPEKPPISAYSLFSKLMLQDKDHHLVEGEPKSRMKEVANKWKMLPDESKREYVEEVKHMLEKYKLEFANYLDSLPEDKKAEELAKIQPKKRTTQPKKVKQDTTDETDLFKNEPPKPPVTAWDLFKNEYVKKNSNLTSKEAFRKAAELWKNLPSKETEKYKKKHESLKAKYMHDFERFLKSLSESELTEYSSWKNNLVKEDSAEKSSDEDDGSSSSSGNASSAESDSGVSEDEC